jgi:hypothetical protein
MDNIESELSYLTNGQSGSTAEAQLYKMLKPDELQGLALNPDDPLEDLDMKPENLIEHRITGPKITSRYGLLRSGTNFVTQTKAQKKQVELDRKQLNLRKLFTALQNDTIMYKFDHSTLQLHIVDARSKRLISKVKMPQNVLKSFKNIKKSFSTLKKLLLTYEKDSLNKIFKSYMEKSYKDSLSKISAQQDILAKQKVLSEIQNAQEKQYLLDQELANKKLDEEALKTKQRALEILKKKKWQAKKVKKENEIKWKIDQEFKNGFDRFVRGSLMGLGINGKGIEKTLAGELFREKEPVWLAKYKLRLESMGRLGETGRVQEEIDGIKKRREDRVREAEGKARKKAEDEARRVAEGEKADGKAEREKVAEAEREVEVEAERRFSEKMQKKAEAKLEAVKAKMEAEDEAAEGSVVFPKHNLNIMLKKVLKPAGEGAEETEVDKRKPVRKFETLESIFFALRKSENALNLDPELDLASKALAKQEGGRGAAVDSGE